MGTDELHEQLFVSRECLIDQCPFRGLSRTLMDSGGQASRETIYCRRVPQHAIAGSHTTVRSGPSVNSMGGKGVFGSLQCFLHVRGCPLRLINSSEGGGVRITILEWPSCFRRS